MSDPTRALTLITPRLRLVPATLATIDAELEGKDRLAEVLGATVSSDWPPEHHDAETLRFWRRQLARPGADAWGVHFALVTESHPPTLVGSVGYKGPPAGGVVEIGYSVVPSWQRRGLATEACRRLIESAWERGANAVIAHTFAHLEPSLGVLRKLGFQPAEPDEPGELAFRLVRD
jgi:RimJ/RimL family protein N-acetyltransferase